ncbi:GyrI-like domain-containing protein [Carnobacterium maltaromaticum]|uniref:GyrI-like domain-containing protein n=1 Tax=Carnobacterium maltaromaticum TaxID=2751 RepID=UPI0039B00A07
MRLKFGQFLKLSVLCQRRFKQLGNLFFSEWLPHSDYLHAEGPEVEWYSIGNPTAENYVSEIWIPIMMKEATN